MALAAIGTFFGVWFYWRGSLERSTKLAEWQPTIYHMIQRKFFFDELYQFVINRIILSISYVVSWFDRYVVNDTGVDGSGELTKYSGFVLKHLQTGKVPNYALVIVVGIVMLSLITLVLRG